MKDIQELTVRDFYGEVWREYADPGSHPITARALLIQAAAVDKWLARQGKPERILDLGCGPLPVIEHTAARRVVVYADLVRDMLAKIRRSSGRSAVCLDALHLPFRGERFDFIWCGLLADHILAVRAWIHELLRTLAPGGSLGLACWHRRSLPAERYPSDRKMRYTSADKREFAVPSFPTWEETLQILESLAPDCRLHTHPVVPNQYELDILFARPDRPSGPDNKDFAPDLG